jgi:hypothetical protein
MRIHHRLLCCQHRSDMPVTSRLSTATRATSPAVTAATITSTPIASASTSTLAAACPTSPATI